MKSTDTVKITEAISSAEISFFELHQGAFPIYEEFRKRLQAEFPDTQVRVQKTQITFTNPKVYACVSFLPLRKKAERPENFIVITFGMEFELKSPRIDVTVEPYPDRWTHHVLISNLEEIDDELMQWIEDSYAFSKQKHRIRRN